MRTQTRHRVSSAKVYFSPAGPQRSVHPAYPRRSPHPRPHPRPCRCLDRSHPAPTVANHDHDPGHARHPPLCFQRRCHRHCRRSHPHQYQDSRMPPPHRPRTLAWPCSPVPRLHPLHSPAAPSTSVRNPPSHEGTWRCPPKKDPASQIHPTVACARLHSSGT